MAFQTRPAPTCVLLLLLATLSLCVSSGECQGKRDLLTQIDGHIAAGRYQYARLLLNDIPRVQKELVDTPRFLFSEARVLQLSGLPDEALTRLDQLTHTPGWEEKVSSAATVGVRLQALRSLGRSDDALRILESHLPPLDELDPPYASEVTQLYTLYADLLMNCLKPKEAIQVLFDLLDNGYGKEKTNVALALLSVAEAGALGGKDWIRLMETLAEIKGPVVWHRFAQAAFDSARPDLARKFLEAGMAENPQSMRALWPGFLESVSNEAFLEVASETILSRTEEPPAKDKPDWWAVQAHTLQKIGRFEEAIKIIEDHLWGEFDLRVNAAQMHAAGGNIESASGIFAELELIAPGSFLNEWGSLFADAGETGKALEIWSKVRLAARSEPLGYRQWGQLLLNKGFPNEAKEVFQEGLAKSGNIGMFAHQLLDVSLSLGEVEGALTAYERLAAQSAKHNRAWSDQGLIDRLKRTQQTEPFFRRLKDVLDATQTVDASWRDLAVKVATKLIVQLDQAEVVRKWLRSPPTALIAYWGEDEEKKLDHLSGLGVEFSILGENHIASEILQSVSPEYLATKPAVLARAAKASARIGDITAALVQWEALFASAMAGDDIKRDACLAQAEIYLQQFEPGKSLEWLKKSPAGNRVPSVSAELAFSMARAYTQLHQKSRALALFEEVVNLERNRAAEATFWLAEWSLWQREWDDARELYRIVLESDPGQDLVNEALWQIRFLTQAEEEKLPAYAVASFFEAGGRWKEAEENYRKLAAEMVYPPLADWIYYRIGKILIKSGKKSEGLRQWQVLLEKSDNQTLTKRIQYEIAGLPQPATGSPEDPFLDIVMDSPDTLIGDMARREAENRESGSDLGHGMLP